MLPYTAWKYKHVSKVGGQTWLYNKEITARYSTFRFMLIELSSYLQEYYFFFMFSTWIINC